MQLQERHKAEWFLVDFVFSVHRLSHMCQTQHVLLTWPPVLKKHLCAKIRKDHTASVWIRVFFNCVWHYIQQATWPQRGRESLHCTATCNFCLRPPWSPDWAFPFSSREAVRLHRTLVNTHLFLSNFLVFGKQAGLARAGCKGRRSRPMRAVQIASICSTNKHRLGRWRNHAINVSCKSQPKAWATGDWRPSWASPLWITGCLGQQSRSWSFFFSFSSVPYILMKGPSVGLCIFLKYLPFFF